jgi:hypothetical protein
VLQPDNSRVVVGMSDHMLSVKQRITQVEDPLAVSTHSASYRYFLRGKSSAPVETDLKVCAASPSTVLLRVLRVSFVAVWCALGSRSLCGRSRQAAS